MEYILNEHLLVSLIFILKWRCSFLFTSHEYSFLVSQVHEYWQLVTFPKNNYTRWNILCGFEHECMNVAWIIIILGICKAPTLCLKVLNKHRITYNVHRDGKCYQQFNKKLTHNVDISKGSSITTWKMHTHTHTHTHTLTLTYTLYRLIWVKDSVKS